VLRALSRATLPASALPVRARRRRRVVLAAAVLAGVLLIVVLATGWAGGGSSGVTTVGGNASAVVYPAGHRPLAPEFTGTTLTGSKLSFSSYRGRWSYSTSGDHGACRAVRRPRSWPRWR